MAATAAGRGVTLVYHVHFTCAPDYMARRLPFRPGHLTQLATLRAEGRVVAGGPEPGGPAANVLYRGPHREELARLLEENEFNRAGLFTSQEQRQLPEFLAPLMLPSLEAGLSAS